jgi:hypothetical protein
MKTIIRFIILLNPIFLCAQITTPVIRANFGVDGDLRANYFNGLLQAGNDDWFNNGAAGSGLFVIDTNGAASKVAGYLTDVSPWPRRMASFYRVMSRPTFSINNNRLWLDALFVRDYHGQDTTTFAAGSNKNGQSPDDWTGVVQGVPDKNDILDMFVHIRRAGPNSTDSLWLFGGVSMDNTTGNRYFDFEMYQSDINYDRVSQQFYGYGPDFGHTTWLFDAAGNVIKPGDIIFSGEFQSSTLTNIEARIWVEQSSLSLTPAQFNWGGLFDGAAAGSTYGYASITPKSAGAFYTGLGCPTNTWGGPFQIVLQNNTMAVNYIKDQFIEFSVNLSKLGLDPVGLLGGDICGTPFRRILVKTRASASFTSELKDFVAPTDLFLAPRVDALADVPVFCGAYGVSTIQVQNPWGSSVYTWSTLGSGHIVGSNTGTSIQVDSPGVYMVMQQLATGCNPYAYDTVTIIYDSTCTPLERNLLSFTGAINNKITRLNWRIAHNEEMSYFDIERSFDGRFFEYLDRVNGDATQEPANYSATDDLTEITPRQFVYYRLKLKKANGGVSYSNIIRLPFASAPKRSFAIAPNPVKDMLQITITTSYKEPLELMFYDMSGKLVRKMTSELVQGSNVIGVDNFIEWQKGMYLVVAKIGDTVYRQKIVLTK